MKKIGIAEIKDMICTYNNQTLGNDLYSDEVSDSFDKLVKDFNVEDVPLNEAIYDLMNDAASSGFEKGLELGMKVMRELLVFK
ncbi:MAG: hypothetical protein Q4F95_15185 [Oscillospiraceae bacterium]|nr:hypothetical protein [Oscillospiraceae bacterium]